MSARFAAGAVLGAFGYMALTWTVNDKRASDYADKPPFDLVCIIGGEVETTRHAGVTHASAQAGGAWAITYVEGGERVYLQRPGEACGPEASLPSLHEGSTP